ncbi:ribonuclease HII [Corynebacterium tuscaniense]|uniref:Ribonuclease HII n=1 Tax=Corynebacterium tuscaniense TaxID=302449 RepID=A0A2N6T401_9CORY|nr:ribonuclease HII [Corynebacterium tuscaniense]KGF25159.1 ribonuclease HII [Corynebacterium tuscaniense DNF00037]PMC64046.1 ribonuclease HII [Corynebacterium tuscaniense]
MRRLKQLRTYEAALDKAGLGPVAGIDEAGRGACFGPITIAACILPSRPLLGLEELTDSKKLTPKKREVLFNEVVSSATAYSIVHISAGEIDRRGIQNANLDGARRAISELSVEPGFVLVDAFRVPGLTTPQLPIVGGDYTARCIAAASVLAKVSRDRLIIQMAEEFPDYGLKGHKGYGTQAHMDAVRRHGASPEHRYTYANVAAAHQTYMRSTRR